MAARRTGSGGDWRRFVAWAGLLLMVASIGWLQLAPRAGAPDDEPTAEQPTGPIACVIIDAGHGGPDSGAVHAGVQEKDLTLDVALRVARIVRARGLKTVLTREGDEAVSLADRATIANRERNCIFVSIHFDDGARAAATGVQTFYAARKMPKHGVIATWLPFLQPVSNPDPNVESQSLAGLMQESLVARPQAVNRGIRAQQFYVVANVRHPAVLVEGGFLTNSDDVAKLKTEAYRERLATAISEGILRYSEIAGQQSSGAADQPRT
jgi:N-acetylmuramoyl-L-alanine amidase